MAYCPNCGAYSPDGQVSCLACGFSEQASASAAQASAAAAKAQQQTEDMREVMERHRKLQQEKNRQWAEQEFIRRQAAKEAAEEEYRRRMEEKERAAQSYVNNASGTTGAKRGTGLSGVTGSKVLSVLSYFGLLCILPYIIMPNDKYARFHAGQGLRLMLFSWLVDFASAVTPLAWMIQLARVYFLVKGVMNAAQDKMEPLPGIGTIGKT